MLGVCFSQFTLIKYTPKSPRGQHWSVDSSHYRAGSEDSGLARKLKTWRSQRHCASVLVTRSTRLRMCSSPRGIKKYKSSVYKRYPADARNWWRKTINAKSVFFAWWRNNWPFELLRKRFDQVSLRSLTRPCSFNGTLKIIRSKLYDPFGKKSVDAPNTE